MEVSLYVVEINVLLILYFDLWDGQYESYEFRVTKVVFYKTYLVEHREADALFTDVFEYWNKSTAIRITLLHFTYLLSMDVITSRVVGATADGCL